MIARACRMMRVDIMHPVLALGAGIGLFVDTYYLVDQTTHSVSEMFLFVVYALLCAAIPWIPKTAGCGVIVWYLLCAAIPSTDAGSMLAGVCVAFATVFAFMSTPVDLMLLGISVLTLYLTSTADTTIAMVIVQTSSALADYASKRHMDANRQREQLAEARRKVAAMSRDMTLATRLHDTVTNDLSSIITIASTRILDSTDTQDRRTLNAISDRSQHAFAKTHEVIDVLSGKEWDSTAQTVISLKRELELTARKAETQLRRLGLIGNVLVVTSHATTRISRDVYVEITGLMSEVFANLRRHCGPHTDYTVIIDVGERSMTLTAMNTLNAKPAPVSPSSGKGLTLHRTIIEAMGGELTFGADPDTWTLRAAIPLAASKR